MGSEANSDPIFSTPKLPLFSSSIPKLDEPEPPGMLTPPLRTSASVPFQWEEEPGKPKPCTALIPYQENNILPKMPLELPPRLVVIDQRRMTKTPSPTTVLDKSVFSSSSFSFRRQGSSGSTFNSPAESGPSVKKGRGIFGRSFRLGSIRRIVGKKGSPVISSTPPSSMGTPCFDDYETVEFFGSEVEDKKTKKRARMKRNGSFAGGVTRSHFWAAIYDGFKQVIPWRSKKSRGGELII